MHSIAKNRRWLKLLTLILILILSIAIDGGVSSVFSKFSKILSVKSVPTYLLLTFTILVLISGWLMDNRIIFNHPTIAKIVYLIFPISIIIVIFVIVFGKPILQYDDRVKTLAGFSTMLYLFSAFTLFLGSNINFAMKQRFQIQNPVVSLDNVREKSIIIAGITSSLSALGGYNQYTITLYFVSLAILFFDAHTG